MVVVKKKEAEFKTGAVSVNSMLLPKGKQIIVATPIRGPAQL
jgi:hypothetical protein